MTLSEKGNRHDGGFYLSRQIHGREEPAGVVVLAFALGLQVQWRVAYAIATQYGQEGHLQPQPELEHELVAVDKLRTSSR